MAGEFETAETIFYRAIELDEGSRKAFLAEACGDNTALRQEVENLVADHARAEGFLEEPAAHVPTVDILPVIEGPGTVIGRYKLLQQIGEGGFGVVFMAQQLEPVKRKVALKIIKPGMDTKQVIARFEAERQALALMDHPNIAKILDAGATDSGRPYFVMELVRGVPITEFCDQNNLSPRERLELFVTVCQAVQHAHQKGIIHRDIKPGNVLITLDDSGPLVTVIDFGVAKAIGRELTEKTLFTRFEQMIGTPLYMSPEQTEMRTRDVDTRSDVYSLGVLLYELLTGTTPLEKDRLGQAAYDEIWRIIREEEPPKPSARISTLGDAAPAIAQHRKTEPKKLTAFIRGDLDWIIMKALEKSRDRRFESASSLARDVQRYLDGEPVEARAPTIRYRLKKYVIRNRALVAGGGIAVTALIAGLAAALISLAQLQRTLVELSDAIFDRGVTSALSGDVTRTEEAIVHLTRVSATDRAAMLRALSLIVDDQHIEAVTVLEPLVEQNRDSVSFQSLLTIAYQGKMDPDRWFFNQARLQQMASESAEDYLFKAAATYWVDSRSALNDADRAIERRRSPVAYLVRGRALAYDALVTGRTRRIPDALSDIARARAWLGSDGIAGYVALEALLNAANSALVSGDREQYATVLDTASDVAREIEQQRQLTLSLWEHNSLGQYYCERGELKEALRHYREAAQKDKSDSAARYFALAIELGEPIDPEIKRIARSKAAGAYSQIALAVLLIIEGRAIEASKMVQPSTIESQTLDALTATCLVLHMVGQIDKAAGLAIEAHRHWRDRELDPWNEWMRDNLLRYYTKDIDADALLQRAKSSDYPRMWLAVSHSSIAGTMFGEHRLEEAKRHYEQCVALRVTTLLDYTWGRAMLKVLDSRDVSRKADESRETGKTADTLADNLGP